MRGLFEMPGSADPVISGVQVTGTKRNRVISLFVGIREISPGKIRFIDLNSLSQTALLPQGFYKFPFFNDRSGLVVQGQLALVLQEFPENLSEVLAGGCCRVFCDVV